MFDENSTRSNKAGAMEQNEIFFTETFRLFGASSKIIEAAEKIELPLDAKLEIKKGSHIIYINISCENKDSFNCALKALEESEISPYIAPDGIETLEEAVVWFLKKKGLTLSLAESCTGGMCAARIVNVSGASDVFFGSVVSYSNTAKNKLLRVHSSTLEKYGAVSAQTVIEMAKGARHSFGSDVAVSVSGIAGPTGGTEQKPVGTVYIGYSSSNGSLAIKASLGNRGRNKIREKSADLMLCTVLEHIIPRKDKAFTL